MDYYFLDTSALLDGAIQEYDKIYTSPLVLSELEHIKNSFNKDEEIKYKARNAVRDIINKDNISYVFYPRKKIEHLLKKYDFLTNINDHYILCEAELLGIEIKHQINFVTCDRALYLFAQQLPHIKAQYFINLLKNEYSGWKDYYPTDLEMIELYSHPEHNIFNAKQNQFIKIFEDNKLKDILFWDGQKHRKISYKEFTSVLGERIKPRNIEQKMYLDLLQNHDIPIKLCIAKFGTGKSFLALSYALNAVTHGNFDKIIFVKNNLDVKGSGKLGTLPGGEIEKQYPWLRQIEDHLGPEKFEEYLDTGIIEPAHLSTLRGRDLKNCIIIVDEAENLLATNIQLLIGRVAENSEIIFCADVKQCDYKDEKMSGIPLMIERLQGKPLFGMVKLIKSERSPVSQYADWMD